MGFDYGRQRTGIAIVDLETRLPTPVTTLQSIGGHPNWEAIGRLIKEWRPTHLIVGMPRKLDGSNSSMTQEIKEFAAALSHKTKLPVDFADEQLSSREAEARLKLARQSGRKRRIAKTDIDQLAATIILENWLESSTE